ncbi:MAG: hypothetical protein JO154_13800 [Chitinophaga sp.]|uniref:hypothetical protein n=1 Tax=Chitinophaga sp. TaxID=1869181 RepID=UPI0025C3E080|nr:hypothetical protein [Chitinophaga sp.]MBV8253677.1 hypothetical protein [Chitinophaga sp.]
MKNIDYKELETPIGTMFACAVPEGICLLEFAEREILQQQYAYLTKTPIASPLSFLVIAWWHRMAL